jgi:hypothetical protein
MEQEKDETLWRIARQRASFRRSLYSFIIVILFLWAIWWFTSGTDYLADGRRGIPWPCWVMLGWGFGLAMQYFKAYHGNKQDLTNQEYEKLKREQNL